jgi:lysophospholipase L1-like esterase
MKRSSTFARVLGAAALLVIGSAPADAQNLPDGNAARGNSSDVVISKNLPAATQPPATDAVMALLTNFASSPAKSEAMTVLPEALAYAPLRETWKAKAAADIADDADKTGSALRPRMTFHVASSDPRLWPRLEEGGLTILQIGDSHTAADFFTGEVRRSLQARYGNGGPGYIDAGKPHPGIRTASLNVTASPGWTYSALQKSENGAAFYLSGFAAKTARSGEMLTFSARQPIPYDLVEIEVITGPKSGAIRVALDTIQPFDHSLVTPHNDHVVYRFMPEDSATGKLQRISITTSEDLPVAVSSVGIFNRRYGVSYSNIGFPGATVDLINKFESNLFRDELKRLAPQIVVLGFGTNEGFNDNLDINRYREHYLEVIRKIRASLPDVKIVMIGPPQAGRKSSSCSLAANCREHSAEAIQCEWASPPQLVRVREVQKELAKQEGIAFWDWAGIMPAKCGAHVWHMAATPLVTADHVHLTPEGYRLSASRFAEFLFPIVDRFKSKDYALSNH